MESVFEDAIDFQGYGLGSWDTRIVTDMRYMFRATTCVSGFFRGWNTTKVTNMKGMLSFAKMLHRRYRLVRSKPKPLGHAKSHRYDFDVRFYPL